MNAWTILPPLEGEDTCKVHKVLDLIRRKGQMPSTYAQVLLRYEPGQTGRTGGVHFRSFKGESLEVVRTLVDAVPRVHSGPISPVDTYTYNMASYH
jgi:hypothetical protein